MEDVGLIVDIVLALGAATIGGLIAQRLGLPALIGYILAGLAIGPNTPGLVAAVDRVQLLANLGVALLMFGLGVEFSLSEVIRVRRAALLGGAIQIPLTVALGTAAGLAGGWTLGSALLLGGAFAISSSIVALKLLLGRGEAESPQGRVALGLGIVQDLSVVPMLALLPLLAGEQDDLARAVVRSVVVAAVALGAVSAFVLVWGPQPRPR
jgi:CPA2 family monovalent cation:H+ antiporter-2